MPKEVPPNISQVFKDLIPFSAVIIILYALDLVIRNSFKSNVAEGILKIIRTIIYSSRWMDWCHNYLWCLCIILVCRYSWSVNCRASNCSHYICEYRSELQLLQAGEHADKIITSGTQMFIVTFWRYGCNIGRPVHVYVDDEI